MTKENMLRRAMRLVEAHVEPDNDITTVSAHADANARFAAIKRAKGDWFRAQSDATEAKEAWDERTEDARKAGEAYQRAIEHMAQLFRDHDILDAPLPGEMQP